MQANRREQLERRKALLQRREELLRKGNADGLGWKGIAQDIGKLPRILGNAVYPGIPNQIRGIAANPERIPGNLLQGIAELGRSPTAALPSIADYLASKKIISPELAEKVPLRPPSIEGAFISGNEPGDILTQLLAGGVNVPGGAKAAGQVALKSTQAIEKGASKAAMPFKPSAYITSPLSKEDLIANLRAAEGTQTPLGNIIDSPLLKGIFENLTTEVPFSGSDKITANIENQVKKKAAELLGRSEAGLPPGDRRDQLKSAIEKAFENQRKAKEQLYEPVNRLSEAENLNLTLPSLERLAKEYGSTFNKSPLFKNDPKLKKAFGDLSKLNKTTSEVKHKTIDANGLLAEPTITYPSIVSAKGMANRLESEASRYNRSPNPSDHFIAGKYQDAANAIRSDVNNAIESRGSAELKAAYKKAEKNYAENYSKFLDRDIYKYTQDIDNFDNIINEIIKPGKTTDKYSRLEKIQKVLPKDQKNIIGNEWLRRALDKEGNLDPKQFSRLIDSLGTRQFEALFPDPVYRQELLDYGRLRGMNEKALSRMANPNTGQKGIKPAMIYSQIASALGLMGSGQPVMGIAALLGPQVASAGLNKYLTSPSVRNNLVKKLIEKKE